MNYLELTIIILFATIGGAVAVLTAIAFIVRYTEEIRAWLHQLFEIHHPQPTFQLAPIQHARVLHEEEENRGESQLHLIGTPHDSSRPSSITYNRTPSSNWDQSKVASNTSAPGGIPPRNATPGPSRPYGVPRTPTPPSTPSLIQTPQIPEPAHLKRSTESADYAELAVRDAEYAAHLEADKLCRHFLCAINFHIPPPYYEHARPESYLEYRLRELDWHEIQEARLERRVENSGGRFVPIADGDWDPTTRAGRWIPGHPDEDPWEDDDTTTGPEDFSFELFAEQPRRDRLPDSRLPEQIPLPDSPEPTENDLPPPVNLPEGATQRGAPRVPFDPRFPLRTHTTGDNPFNPRGEDYNWPSLSAADRALFGEARTLAWELHWEDVERRAIRPISWISMDLWLAVNRGDPIEPGDEGFTIEAHIYYNRSCTWYNAESGTRLDDLQPRTAEEQHQLEAALSILAIDNERFRERLREDGLL